MTNAAIPAQDAPKNLGLGRKKEEVTKAIAVARQVAHNTNTPTNVYPQSKQATQPAPTPAPAPEAVTTIEAPLPATEKKARGPRPALVRRYSVDLPLYIIRDIHQLAFDRGVTKKRVILEALQAGGLKVKDVDITESGEVLKGGDNA